MLRILCILGCKLRHATMVHPVLLPWSWIARGLIDWVTDEYSAQRMQRRRRGRAPRKVGRQLLNATRTLEILLTYCSLEGITSARRELPP